jgi:hypothetical protein
MRNPFVKSKVERKSMTYANGKQLMHLVGGSCLDRGASPFSWRAVLPISASSSLTSPHFARGTASCSAAEQAETRHR